MNPIPPEQLVEEVETDPANLGYAGKTPAQIHALMMNPTRTVRRGCKGKIIFNELAKAGIWSKLDKSTEDYSLDAKDGGMGVRHEIKAFMDSCRILGEDEINLRDDSKLAQQLPYLVGLGVVSSQNVALLLALGDVQVTRVQERWGDDASVGVGYLARALNPQVFAEAESEVEQTGAAYSEAIERLTRLSLGEVV